MRVRCPFLSLPYPTLPYLPTYLLTCLLTDWLTDWLTYWLTDWLTDSLTDSLTYLLTYLLAGPTAKHWPDFASLRHAASVYPLVSHAFWTAHGSPNSFPLATEHAGQNGGRKHLLRCCSHLRRSHSWGKGIPNEMWYTLRLGALGRVLGALSWKEKQNMWMNGNHVLTQQHCLAPAVSQH